MSYYEITFQVKGTESDALDMKRYLSGVGAYNIRSRTHCGGSTIQSLQLNPFGSEAAPRNRKSEAALFKNWERKATSEQAA